MKKPLDGVTVLDFTQAFSGPYCTLNLADYGARVIKVERLEVGDQTREWAPLRKAGQEHAGESGYFALYNRNKEGIAVNMRAPEGVEIIKKIAAKADIVVNNFKVGTLDRLGLGYEELKKVNPDIVFTSITGYGQDGPMSGLAAYDNVIEATCGLMDQSGMPDKQPVRSGCSIGDSYTGLMAAFGTACAYYHKLMTGEGQTVDVAMEDSLFASIEDTILEYFGNGRMLQRQGNSRTHMYSPYDVVQCKDGWVAFSAITQKGFEEFCKEAGREDLLADQRFQDNQSRCDNNEALIEEMKKVFADIEMDQVEKRFSGKNFAVAPVIHAGMTIQSKHMNDRNMVIEIDDHNVGKFQAVGHPIKFKKTPATVYKSSPKLGEDTKPVLKELGYTDQEISELSEKGVIQMA